MARKPTVSQKRQIEKLVADLEPTVRDAFIAAIQSAAGQVSIPDLIAALDAGDIAAAVEVLRLNQALLFPLDDAIRSTYLAGAALAAPIAPKAIAGTFSFDGRNPRAEAWIGQIGARLIQGIVSETLDASRVAMLAGLADGRSTRSIALDITGRLDAATGRRIGGILGLTVEQTDWVIRARAELGNPDAMANYLTRKLRDRRFDKIARDAIATGKPVSAADREKMAAAYKDRVLKYRGQVIAKNEVFTAQAAGRDEAMRQIGERADVEKVTVRWQHNLSQNPRPDHVDMDGTVINLGETFDFPDAQMKHPHDPAGGAAHSIGCRCIAVYRVVPK